MRGRRRANARAPLRLSGEITAAQQAYIVGWGQKGGPGRRRDGRAHGAVVERRRGGGFVDLVLRTLDGRDCCRWGSRRADGGRGTVSALGPVPQIAPAHGPWLLHGSPRCLRAAGERAAKPHTQSPPGAPRSASGRWLAACGSPTLRPSCTPSTPPGRCFSDRICNPSNAQTKPNRTAGTSFLHFGAHFARPIGRRRARSRLQARHPAQQGKAEGGNLSSAAALCGAFTRTHWTRLSWPILAARLLDSSALPLSHTPPRAVVTSDLLVPFL